MGQINFDKMSFGDVETNSTPGKIANPELIPKICNLLGIKNTELFSKILV